FFFLQFKKTQPFHLCLIFFSLSIISFSFLSHSPKLLSSVLLLLPLSLPNNSKYLSTTTGVRNTTPATRATGRKKTAVLGNAGSGA
ncbi:unnamed protein product, partial [Linum tenue]